MDGLSENVASYCASRVQLTSHGNAYAERFVRTIKEDCLNRMLFFGEDMLRRSIREFVTHYHEERNHQALDNELLTKPPRIGDAHGRVRRRERIGGLLNYGYREAA